MNQFIFLETSDEYVLVKNELELLGGKLKESSQAISEISLLAEERSSALSGRNMQGFKLSYTYIIIQRRKRSVNCCI